ncbi:MAG: hypothetical protein HYY30_09125 [Chloroflexi bacterium]|nr:hypothetical protein [Chloroflexota bacterium]
MSKKIAIRLICVVGLLLGSLASIISVGIAGAEGHGDVVLSTAYPSVTAGKGQDITFLIEINNKGKVDELLNVKVLTAPKDWEITLKDRNFGIRSLFLLAGKSQSMTLTAKPPENAQPGDYKVVLQATNANGAAGTNLDLNIGLQDKPVGGLKLSTQYPKLTGQSTTNVKFEFSVDIKNDSADPANVGLAANAPKDWQVTFSPAYETKQISTLAVKGNETQGIKVTVAPPDRAPAGDYPIDVTVSAGGIKDSIQLNVTLTGATNMTIDTSDSRLNTQGTAGAATNVTLKLTNNGTADLRNISFSSGKPTDWEVTFTPDKLDLLTVGESYEVNVAVKPTAKAIAGDYSVSVMANSGYLSKDLQLRMTVETPTIWGWVGVAIVVVVLAGLGGLFTRLGRR